MQNPLSISALNSLQAAPAADLSTEGGLLQTAVGTGSIGFPEALSLSEISPQLLDMLRNHLSAEEFEQLEEMLADGKELPLAAIFPLLGIEDVKVALPDVATTQTTSSVAPNPLAGEGMPQQLGERLPQQLDEGMLRRLGERLPLSQQNSQSMLKAENEHTQQLQPTTDLLRETVAKLVGSEQPVVEPQAAALPRVGSPVADVVSTLVVNMEANGMGMAPPPASGATSTAPAQTSPVVVPQAVTIPPGEKGWDQAIGERILWMTGREVQSASVRIRPPNLGPLHIQLSIQNDQASVNFTAQHGIVKEALEAAIPRLREMLADSGIQLVNVDVSQRESSARSDLSDPYQQHEESAPWMAADGTGLEVAVDGPVNYYRSDHLLDDYA